MTKLLSQQETNNVEYQYHFLAYCQRTISFGPQPSPGEKKEIQDAMSGSLKKNRRWVSIQEGGDATHQYENEKAAATSHSQEAKIRMLCHNTRFIVERERGGVDIIV